MCNSRLYYQGQDKDFRNKKAYGPTLVAFGPFNLKWRYVETF